MKNLQAYEKFCLNERQETFFARHNQPSSYKERVSQSYNLPKDSSVLQRVSGFFQGLEDRLNRMASIGQSLQQQRRSERGGGPNTGVESLFGIFSVVPSVLKKVFGPTQYKFGKETPSDNRMDLDFMRHTNEDFAKTSLPYINTEGQLEKNITNTYQKAGVNPGQSPVLDDIMKNRAYLYYMKQKNPTHPMFTTNN